MHELEDQSGETYETVVAVAEANSAERVFVTSFPHIRSIVYYIIFLVGLGQIN